MAGDLLEGDESVENDQLHVVVTLLHYQLNVALGSCLWGVCGEGGGEGGRERGREGRREGGREGLEKQGLHV